MPKRRWNSRTQFLHITTIMLIQGFKFLRCGLLLLLNPPCLADNEQMVVLNWIPKFFILSRKIAKIDQSRCMPFLERSIWLFLFQFDDQNIRNRIKDPDSRKNKSGLLGRFLVINMEANRGSINPQPPSYLTKYLVQTRSTLYFPYMVIS